MSIRVVLVGPKYQINLGYAARVSKNFGVAGLVLVNPRCNAAGSQAIKYSKHARDLLEHAAVVRSLREATSGTFAIGTTGIWHKTEKSFHNVFPLEEFSSKFAGAVKTQDVSLVIGRDDTGLTKDELRMCDATVFIRSNPEYPVLNISHALAIALYELTKGRARYERMESMRASGAERDGLVRLFSTAVRSNASIRDKAAVVMAFRHVINRSMPTAKELSAIAIGLSSRNKKEKRSARSTS